MVREQGRSRCVAIGRAVERTTASVSFLGRRTPFMFFTAGDDRGGGDVLDRSKTSRIVEGCD